MKKITFSIIIVLILTTSLVKNSTKEIEDKIFVLNENIRALKIETGDLMLEYNFLSSPDKLIHYQSQYLEKDLTKVDIMKIKKISEGKNFLELSDFIKKTNDKK